MSRRTSVIGIAVLVALALSAFTAASASAVDRAFKCEAAAAGTAQFKDAHCLTAETGGAAGFKHVLLPETATAITGTNAKTASGTTAASTAVLKGHIAGVETAVSCTTVSGSGSLTNNATSVSGTGTINYSGCTVTLPAGKGCKVTGGAISTKELKATTSGTTGTTLKFEPKSGSEFASVPLEGCEKERPPKGSYLVEGSLTSPTSGATTVATHSEITTQGTLLFGGTVAGLEGAITISAGSSGVTLTP